MYKRLFEFVKLCFIDEVYRLDAVLIILGWKEPTYATHGIRLLFSSVYHSFRTNARLTGLFT